ncbi:hypothetical protein N7E70_016625 [Aminobacter sp. NyZ550]|uniref:hypothetical protein n=1 Tax=Aminobacter sp. NyZ550 TaxID=2979870 RepID=UPI0021D5DE0F|nr:hypothetical protein [Aminobacter sp. NyZ550]WAX93315.1 hypothetical protein N7E70_016625 [Aminobacter sp. NyZ550]
MIDIAKSLSEGNVPPTIAKAMALLAFADAAGEAVLERGDAAVERSDRVRPEVRHPQIAADPHFAAAMLIFPKSAHRWGKSNTVWESRIRQMPDEICFAADSAGARAEYFWSFHRRHRRCQSGALPQLLQRIQVTPARLRQC